MSSSAGARRGSTTIPTTSADVDKKLKQLQKTLDAYKNVALPVKNAVSAVQQTWDMFKDEQKGTNIAPLTEAILELKRDTRQMLEDHCRQMAEVTKSQTPTAPDSGVLDEVLGELRAIREEGKRQAADLQLVQKRIDEICSSDEERTSHMESYGLHKRVSQLATAVKDTLNTIPTQGSDLLKEPKWAVQLLQELQRVAEPKETQETQEPTWARETREAIKDASQHLRLLAQAKDSPTDAVVIRAESIRPAPVCALADEEAFANCAKNVAATMEAVRMLTIDVAELRSSLTTPKEVMLEFAKKQLVDTAGIKRDVSDIANMCLWSAQRLQQVSTSPSAKTGEEKTVLPTASAKNPTSAGISEEGRIETDNAQPTLTQVTRDSASLPTPPGPQCGENGSDTIVATACAVVRREQPARTQPLPPPPASDIKPDGGQSEAGEWETTRRRRRRNRGHKRGKQTATPKNPAPNNPPPPKITSKAAPLRTAPHPSPTERRARPEALIIKVDKNQTLQGVVKQLQDKIDLEAVGVGIKSVKSTLAGDVIITMTQGEGQAALLKKKIGEVAGELPVRALTQRTMVEILGMGITVTKPDILKALTKTLGDTSDLNVTAIKNAARGTKKAKVILPPSKASVLLEGAPIQIGWSRCAVREAPDTPVSCYRCLGVGHIGAHCSGPDRGNSCLHCGKEGHRLAACKNKPFCIKCNVEGHREGANCNKQQPSTAGRARPQQRSQRASQPPPRHIQWVAGGIQQGGSLQGGVVLAGEGPGRETGATRKGATIGSDREAIQAGKRGQYGEAITIAESPLPREKKAPIEPITSAMTRSGEKFGAYRLASLRDNCLRDNVKQYVAYYHKQSGDHAVKGRSRMDVASEIQSAGLPVEVAYLKELYGRYLKAYNIEGDMEADLESCARHMASERLLHTQRVRAAAADFMSPVRPVRPPSKPLN